MTNFSMILRHSAKVSEKFRPSRNWSVSYIERRVRRSVQTRLFTQLEWAYYSYHGEHDKEVHIYDTSQTLLDSHCSSTKCTTVCSIGMAACKTTEGNQNWQLYKSLDPLSDL